MREKPAPPPTESKSATSLPLEDKRARHKLVERRRRDKTRAYVEQLQSLLPNIGHSRPNPNVNFASSPPHMRRCGDRGVEPNPGYGMHILRLCARRAGPETAPARGLTR